MRGATGSNQYQKRGIGSAPQGRGSHADMVSAIFAEHEADTDGHITELDLVAASFTDDGAAPLLKDYATVDEDVDVAAGWANTGIDPGVAEIAAENGITPVVAAWWSQNSKLGEYFLEDWADSARSGEMPGWVEVGVFTAWEADQWANADASPADVIAARENGWGAASLIIQAAGAWRDRVAPFRTTDRCFERTKFGAVCHLTVADGKSTCGHAHDGSGAEQIDNDDVDEDAIDAWRDEASDANTVEGHEWFVAHLDDGRWVGHAHETFDEDGGYDRTWVFADEHTAGQWASAQSAQSDGYSPRPPDPSVLQTYTFPHSGSSDPRDWDHLKDWSSSDLEGVAGIWRVVSSDISGLSEDDSVEPSEIVDKIIEYYCDGYGGTTRLDLSPDGVLSTDDGRLVLRPH